MNESLCQSNNPDPFLCILHNCTLSRSACDKRRGIDTETAWNRKIEIDCHICRNPEVIVTKQPSRARLDMVKCYYCNTRRPKEEMKGLPGYSNKWKCTKCSPRAARGKYLREHPTLSCWKCRQKFSREIMIKQGKSANVVCPECSEKIKKRKRDYDRTGLTEWKCRTCGTIKRRTEYYTYDLMECKKCKSERVNNRQKRERREHSERKKD